LIAVWACALAGCWEEVHYSPPAPGAGPVAAAPPPSEAGTASDDADVNFGDDVAQSLAEESVTEQSQPVATDAGDSAPIAIEAEPPVETPSTNAAEVLAAAGPSSRYAAWSLGSTLSLAALANDRAASEDKVVGWFNTARQQAEVLGTTVAELPPRPAAGQVDMAGTRATEYLLNQGQAIGSHLATTLGDDHSALFEVALKSNLLLVRYEPGAKFSDVLGATIGQASARAQLPPELVQPIVQAVEAKSAVKAVRDAVFDMHDRVGKYLSTGQL